MTDADLTLEKIIELSGVLRDLDGAIANFQIDAVSAIVSGSSVLTPVLHTSTMQTLLAHFGGKGPAPTIPAESPEPSGTAPTNEIGAPGGDGIVIGPPVNASQGIISPPAIDCS